MTGIERLHAIMTRLRDPETGCPWDKVQTLETLKPCVLEETYELLSAMDRPEDRANHIEELGDVLLQVMFQCVMAEQEGRFSFDDVANAISEHVRMAVDELVRNRVGDVVKREAPLLLGHDALEHHLQENVAKFLDMVCDIVGTIHRREQLIRLLQYAGL